MSSAKQSPAGQHDGHALSVERLIDAPSEAIFDAFVALYDSQRPDWVTDSQLDLRPGGRIPAHYAQVVYLTAAAGPPAAAGP